VHLFSGDLCFFLVCDVFFHTDFLHSVARSSFAKCGQYLLHNLRVLLNLKYHTVINCTIVIAFERRSTILIYLQQSAFSFVKLPSGKNTATFTCLAKMMGGGNSIVSSM
jgi:hypothetical protein